MSQATGPVVKDIPEETKLKEAQTILDDVKKNGKFMDDSLKARAHRTWARSLIEKRFALRHAGAALLSVCSPWPLMRN